MHLGTVDRTREVLVTGGSCCYHEPFLPASLSGEPGRGHPQAGSSCPCPTDASPAAGTSGATHLFGKLLRLVVQVGFHQSERVDAFHVAKDRAKASFKEGAGIAQPTTRPARATVPPNDPCEDVS